jgi:hypothetical protein
MLMDLADPKYRTSFPTTITTVRLRRKLLQRLITPGLTRSARSLAILP